MRELTFTVPKRYDGATMQQFLRQECGLSWRMVVRLKRVERGMTADGEPKRSIDPVFAGQTGRLDWGGVATLVVNLTGGSRIAVRPFKGQRVGAHYGIETARFCGF